MRTSDFDPNPTCEETSKMIRRFLVTFVLIGAMAPSAFA